MRAELGCLQFNGGKVWPKTLYDEDNGTAELKRVGELRFAAAAERRRREGTAGRDRYCWFRHLPTRRVNKPAVCLIYGVRH